MNVRVSTIPYDWKVTKLGDVGTTVTGKTPSQNNSNDWGNLTDFITPTDIVSDSKYIAKVARKLSDNGKNRFNKMVIPSGSVVVSCIGSDMGKVVINKHKALTNQQINSIKVNSNYDSNYIYYLLKNSHAILRNIAVGGSTMPILNKSTFESLSFLMPPYPEQQAIAAVLSSLDDKIELLREQNKTLEATAQTIFKEWFVKFNFPGSTGKMIDSELGEIPDGWRVGLYSDLVTVVTGKGINKDNLSGDGKYQVLGANGKIGRTNEYLFDEDLILTGRVGTLGTIYFSKGKVWISDNVLISKPVIEKYYYFAYQTLKLIDLNILNRGSTQPLVTQTDLKNIIVVLPTDEVLVIWHVLASGLFSKRFSNDHQIQALSSLRDAFIPKLMKGEIRVSGFN